MASDLNFPPDTRNDGFSIDSMARRNGMPETVIRELLQNSLDAAREAGKGTREDPARVMFTIKECRWEDVPGAKSYREAFDRAVVYRRQQAALAEIDERVVKRITDALSKPAVRLLLCRDNGVGIDDMERIMNEANTGKPKQGGGSIGVGHLTAYAASDTRYVLYAGRSIAKGDIAGGHAILAAHIAEGKRVSANGYYVREGTDLFSLQSRYQADIPPLLQQELNLLSDTGSVVCITGFNDFRGDNPVAEISKVAAIYFLGAILRGELVVDIEDKLQQNSRRVDNITLRSILRRYSNEQRTRTGWLAGNFAMRAYETLRGGRNVDLNPHLEVWWRRLQPNERSQVNIYRGGMWVARNPITPAGLSPQSLSNLNSFDCVLLLHPSEDDGSLYRLARAAEGTDHIEFSHYAELSSEQKRRMRERFEEVARALSEAVGTRDDKIQYSPEGFASVHSIGSQPRQVLPRIRHRSEGGRVATTEIEDEEEQREHEASDPEPRPGPPRPGVRPAPGRRVWIQSTINVGEYPRTLIMAWRPQRGEDSHNLAVRVFVPSGSDETCERPLSPQWLKLEAIEANGATNRVGKTPYEVPLPHQPGVVKIRLAEPLGNVAGIEIDVVRRRPITANTREDRL